MDLTGIPTEVPVAGQERWLGLFLRFDRLLSDPRTDGNSQQVFFRRDESFEVVVRQGPLGPVGGASKVPVMPDELLICDVLRKNAQTQILAPDIDVTRRQAFIFAQGDAVEIVSSVWSVLAPAVDTVQAALDEIDSELAGHFGGSARRHPASDIDYTPHGFVAAGNVQAALDEVVDDLSASAAGNPGAQRVGADAVSGTPHALTASNVDSHLSQLLGWLNAHLAAASGAHNASAIAAAVHSYIAGTTVQAQLQEIVSDLALQTAGSAGASRIGADAVSGSPNALAAGTVDSQLAELLADGNNHVGATSGAHAASAISVADSGGNLTASNVETALAEILDAFEDDHYRGNESNAGQHRAIRQPNFGSGKVLLWDAVGVGSNASHFRVHADSDSIWFTVNAFWNGSAWQRDLAGNYAGGFRFSRTAFEMFHDNSFTLTFTDWTRTWRLPMSGTVNSAFEMTGSTTEVGRLGYEMHNTYNATRNMAVGGANTFRSRFPSTPSSITFSETSSYNTDGPPGLWDADRDGFGFFDYVNVAANSTLYWFGTYTAVA